MYYVLTLSFLVFCFLTAGVIFCYFAFKWNVKIQFSGRNNFDRVTQVQKVFVWFFISFLKLWISCSDLTYCGLTISVRNEKDLSWEEKKKYVLGVYFE